MQINFEGTSYTFDFNDIDVQQSRAIKAHTGLAFAPWQRAIFEADPEALQALLWVMKQQNGERAPDPSSLRFKPSELIRAVNEALTDEALGTNGTNGTNGADPTNGKPAVEPKSAATTD